MEETGLSMLRTTAFSLGRASKYLASASLEVGRVALPALASIMRGIPKAASATLVQAREAESAAERKSAAMRLGVGVFAATALGVATVAHFANKISKRKAKRDQKKQIAAAIAREQQIDDTIASAAAICAAKDIVDENGDLSFAQESGCFAILTYEPDVAEKDRAAYRDVYVGASTSMLEGAKKQLTGEGNLYVHADMAYDRPVYVAFYPCEEYVVYAKREHLVEALGAQDSYNGVANLAELD